MPIEHLHQMLKYSSSDTRLFVQLKQGGAESTASGTPTVTIYNPEGTALLSAQNLTTLAVDAWYYYDADISVVATWPKNRNYRAEYTWVDSGDSRTYERTIYFDVVRQPWNDPEITTEEVAVNYAEFDGMLPVGWTDWTPGINIAHRDLIDKLRNLQVNGAYVMPNLVLDRNNFAKAELAFAARVIAQRTIDLRDDQQMYVDNAHGAWDELSSGPFAYDIADDDGEIDEGTEGTVIPRQYVIVR